MEKTGRGWTMESYRDYMKRRDAEEQMIKASDKQVGGSHYKDFKIMPIEYITQNKLDFCEGNIVKYISRHAKKNGAEDIRKVIHYAELILQQKYGKDF
jgi:hypothetical protein